MDDTKFCYIDTDKRRIHFSIGIDYFNSVKEKDNVPLIIGNLVTAECERLIEAQTPEVLEETKQ